LSKPSPSSYNKWLDCNRAWKYAYIDRKVSTNLSFELKYGLRFHSLKEGAEPDVDLGVKWNKIIEEHEFAHRQYWSAHSKLKVIDTEVEIDDWFRGYIDAVVVDDRGDRWLLEYKTTGSQLDVGSSYWSYHRLQTAMYASAFDCRGVIVDVSRRPTIRQRKNESDIAYIQRCSDWFYDNRDTVFARKTYHDDPELVLECKHIDEQIAAAKSKNQFPRNSKACYKGRNQCEYYDVCWNGESLDNEQLFQIKTGRK